MMERMLLSNEMTRFLSDDQYLNEHTQQQQHQRPSDVTCVTSHDAVLLGRSSVNLEERLSYLNPSHLTSSQPISFHLNRVAAVSALGSDPVRRGCDQSNKTVATKPRNRNL